MSLITLFVVVFVTWLVCSFFDSLPALLFGWLHLPSWLLWVAAIAVVAWFMDDKAASP